MALWVGIHLSLMQLNRWIRRLNICHELRNLLWRPEQVFVPGWNMSISAVNLDILACESLGTDFHFWIQPQTPILWLHFPIAEVAPCLKATAHFLLCHRSLLGGGFNTNDDVISTAMSSSDAISQGTSLHQTYVCTYWLWLEQTSKSSPLSQTWSLTEGWIVILTACLTLCCLTELE